MTSVNYRLQGVFTLLAQLPFDGLHSVLDIGAGNGEIAEWFLDRDKRVVGTGYNMRTYRLPAQLQARLGTAECLAEGLPFADRSFDLVIMSHVLEHCPNVGLVLREAHRVLTDHGRLLLFVPPHDDRVLAGHVSMGWNLGQLMYTLLLHNFDVRHGHFAYLAWNVGALVGKDPRPLPRLRGDQGDIRTLAEAGRWPEAVQPAALQSDGFWGVLGAVNWPARLPGSLAPSMALPVRLIQSLPARARFKLGVWLGRAGQWLMRSSTVNPERLP